MVKKEDVDKVYEYVLDKAKLGMNPGDLAKVLNMEEEAVIEILKELSKRGKILLKDNKNRIYRG